MRITIIGAGIAGCTAAYFTREVLGPDVEIVVLEGAPRIGGRVQSVELGGLEVEAGAEVIHSSNRHITTFVDQLGLHRVPKGPEVTTAERGGRADPAFGIWDGTSFDLVSSGSKFAMVTNMFVRYKLTLVSAMLLVRRAAQNLLRIYDLQQDGASFATPEGLLRSVNLYGLSQQASDEYFLANHVSADFIRSLANPVSRAIYSQNSSINALASLVSLVGTGYAGGSIYAVREGNKRICQILLRLSGARVETECPVRTLACFQSTTPGSLGYEIITRKGQRYRSNAVILAAPISDAAIKFVGIDIPKEHIMQEYKTMWVTCVAGSLNNTYFRVSASARLPDAILTKERHDLPFLSLRRIGTTAESQPVYKVSSADSLSEEVLTELFKDRTQTVIRRWSAYPVLEPLNRLLPFRLQAGLYYVNTMEWIISAMETQVIASRNVVNLLSNDLHIFKS